MKYPKINGKKIDEISRRAFNIYFHEIMASLHFDNKENDLKLSDKDIELLAWNCSANLLFNQNTYTK